MAPLVFMTNHIGKRSLFMGMVVFVREHGVSDRMGRKLSICERGSIFGAMNAHNSWCVCCKLYISTSMIIVPIVYRLVMSAKKKERKKIHQNMEIVSLGLTTCCLHYNRVAVYYGREMNYSFRLIESQLS